MSDIQQSAGSLLQPKHRRPSLVCSLVDSETNKTTYDIKCLYGFQPKPKRDTDILVRVDVQSQKNETITKNLFVSIDRDNDGKREIYGTELEQIISQLEKEIGESVTTVTLKVGVFLDIQIEQYQSHLSEFNTTENSDGLLFNLEIPWSKVCEAYTTATLELDKSGF
jgi:hypothetical protein